MAKPANLVRAKRTYFVTADVSNLLSGDPLLGQCGKGYYKVTPLSAAAADSTITLSDGSVDVVQTHPIPVKAAAVTYPQFSKLDDHSYIVNFTGEGGVFPIDIVDGTNAEIAIMVEYLGHSLAGVAL